MALGGMNGGVTVREMAAGFSIFLNDGIFNGARTYTKVLNSDGTVLLENEPLERQVFEREQTVYYMRDVLKGVTSSAMGGTARRINVPGMDVGGKTGTSQKKRDLWFCGFTPYYAGATWFGYDSSYDLSGVSGNPSLTIWNKVMNKVHENLEPAEFDMGDSDNFEKQSYCTVSGLGAEFGVPRKWNGGNRTVLEGRCAEQGLHRVQLCCSGAGAGNRKSRAQSIRRIRAREKRAEPPRRPIRPAARCRRPKIRKMIKRNKSLIFD